MSRPRPLARLALLVAALLVPLLGAILAVPATVRHVGTGALVAAGFAEAAIGEVSLRRDGLLIARVDLAPDGAFVLDDLRLVAGPGDLLRGQVRAIRIGRIRLAAELDEEGRPRLPGYLPPETAEPPADLPFDRIEVGSVELGLAAPGGPLLARIAALGVDVAGMRVAFEGTLDLMAPGLPAARLAGGVRGTADLAEGGLDLAWTVAEGELRADGHAAEGLSGRIAVRLAPGAGIGLEAELAARTARLAGRAVGALALRADLRGTRLAAYIEAPDHGHIDLALDLASLGGRVSGSLAGALGPEGPEGRIAADFDLALDLATRPVAVDGDLDLAGDGLAMAGRFSDGRIAAPLRISGTPERFALSGRAPLHASLLPAPSMWPDAPADWRGERLRLEIVDLAADLDSLASSLLIGGRLDAAIAGAHLRVELAETPVRLDADGGIDAPRIALAAHGPGWRGLGLDLPTAEASLVRKPDAPPEIAAVGHLLVDGEAGGIRLERHRIDWSATASGMTSATLSFHPADLDQGTYALRDMAGEISADAHGLVSARLAIGEFRLAGTPAPLAPLGIEAEASRRDDVLDFTLTASDPLGIVILEAVGRGDLAGGAADLRLYPLTFFPDATEVADISPLLGARLDRAEGTLAFEGHIAWGEDGLRSGGRLDLAAFSARLPQARLIGLETSVAFDSLLPPRTAGMQEIRIEAVDAGILLVEGRARAALDGSLLRVEEVRFGLADGELAAEPFTVDLAAPGELHLALLARAVDLAGLFRIAGVDGLAGEGRVTGRVPLAVSGAGVRIDEGLLEAHGGGILRYAPETPPAFMQGEDMRAQMLREALRNFRYEELSLEVGGDLSAGQRVRLFARGSNPDFLDGHPIELDLELGGALLGAARSAGEIFGGGTLGNLPPPQ